jgi:phage FluMu gp28-like protein
MSLCHYQKSKYLLTFPNGSYIDFRSGERPEMMEGFEYDIIVINEAGIVLEDNTIWHNTIQPMGKNAIFKIIGTPKGDNFFAELYNMANQYHDQYASYHYTAYDSPYWTANSLDNIREQVPDIIWRQEYMAEFINNYQDRPLLPLIELLNTDIINSNIPVNHHGKYILGIDLAKQIDYTVIYILNYHTSTVERQYRFTGINWQDQINKILELNEVYNKPYIAFDNTGLGQVIHDNMLANGILSHQLLPVNISASNKVSLILSMYSHIANKKIHIPAYTELVQEMNNYMAIQNKNSGHINYQAKSGEHDDCIMALAILIKGYSHYQEKYYQPIHMRSV